MKNASLLTDFLCLELATSQVIEVVLFMRFYQAKPFLFLTQRMFC